MYGKLWHKFNLTCCCPPMGESRGLLKILIIITSIPNLGVVRNLEAYPWCQRAAPHRPFGKGSCSRSAGSRHGFGCQPWPHSGCHHKISKLVWTGDECDLMDLVEKMPVNGFKGMWAIRTLHSGWRSQKNGSHKHLSHFTSNKHHFHWEMSVNACVSYKLSPLTINKTAQCEKKKNRNSLVTGCWFLLLSCFFFFFSNIGTAL
jgi:hypothetical protein